MQEAQRKEPRTAEEWKRKFHTETKVNQELGRRLRDMKQRLDEEQQCVDKLRRQVDWLKNQPQEEAPPVTVCTKCVTHEAEIQRLRQLLEEHGIQQDNGPHSTASSSDSPSRLSSSPRRSRSNSLRRSHSILVRQQSGRIQCLRDMLDELTPRVDAGSDPRRNSGGAAPVTPVATSLIPSLTVPVSPQVCSDQPVNAFTRQTNQRIDSAPMTPSGIEDKSLGDLFKYTIVLSGPMAPRPKKNALSVFLKGAAEFRRARSLPESQVIESAPAPAKQSPPVSVTSAGAPTAQVSAERSQGNANTKEKPPSLPIPVTDQGAATNDSARTDSGKLNPPPSPMKKGGWLANIVPPRFRSQSTDAPPSPMSKPAAPSQKAVEAAAKPIPSQTKPRMLGIYPPPVKGEVPELEGLVEICFPYGEKMPPLSDFSVANLRRTLQERHRTYRSPDSTFVLTIASPRDPTDLTYAVCVHLPLFPEDDSGSGFEWSESDGERLPTHGCICLLSPYPFFSLFFKVVFGIASIWESRRKEYVQDHAISLKEKKQPPPSLSLKDFLEHFEGIVKRLRTMRVPAMGGWSRLVLAPQFTPLAFHRPHSESVKAERRLLVLEYAAPMLFALLSLDQVLFLVGSLCCERKVLVVSDHANIVSSCVLALITLLEPLQWAGPVITMLPPRLDELLEAPVPLIAGRVSINSATIHNFSTLTKPMKGVIEMNMDQNNLCMHEEDLMCYHELKLPGCDALVYELQHLSAKLFEHHMDPEFPSIEQVQASEIICARIHRHMRAMCALATGETTTLDIGDVGFAMSPAVGSSSGYVACADATSVNARRRSDVLVDYIQRFQDTQMFSMFTLQRQEEGHEDGDDDDDADDDDDDNSDATATTQGASARERWGDSDEEEGENDDDDVDGDATECTETAMLFDDDDDAAVVVTYQTR